MSFKEQWLYTQIHTPGRGDSIGPWHYVPVNSTRNGDPTRWNKGQEWLSGHMLPCWKVTSTVPRVAINLLFKLGHSKQQSKLGLSQANWDLCYQSMDHPMGNGVEEATLQQQISAKREGVNPESKYKRSSGCAELTLK